MARAAQFTRDALLDAAAAAFVQHSFGATMRHVQEISGAPSGSLYHRFPTRDALFGALWERSIRRFHVGFLEGLSDPDGHEALLRAATHIPRFCREHPADAKAMTLYRLETLLTLVPAEQRDALSRINDGVEEATREAAQRCFGTVGRRELMLAMIASRQCPYGIVRPLVGGPIPAFLDEVCRAAAAGVLTAGRDLGAEEVHGPTR